MNSEATLEQRAAFLIALLGKSQEYHGSYIHEKVRWAMQPGISESTLVSALDANNLARYEALL